MKDKQTILTPFLVCLFFGTLGVHRFYLRKNKTGFLMLMTLGGIGIWYLVDLVLIGKGLLQRKEKQVLPSIKQTV